MHPRHRVLATALCAVVALATLGGSLALALTPPSAATWTRVAPPVPSTTAAINDGIATRLSADGRRAVSSWIDTDTWNAYLRAGNVDGTTVTWGEPSLIGPAYQIFLALSADGSAVAVATMTTSLAGQVASIDATAGISWLGSATTLCASGCSVPEIATASDGTTVLAGWVHQVSTTRYVEVASASVAGGVVSWTSTPGSVFDSPAWIPEVALGLTGDGTKAVLGWTEDSNGDSNTRVFAAIGTVSGTSQTWTTSATPLQTIDELELHSAAISSDGTRALLAWRGGAWNASLYDTAWLPGVASATIVATTPTWTLSAPTVSAPTVGFADAAVSDSGTTALLYWYPDDGLGAMSSVGTASAGGFTWGAERNAAIGEHDIYDVSATISRDGSVAGLTWTGSTDGTYVVRTTTGTTAGSTPTWTDTTTLSSVSDVSGYQSVPSIALARDGTSGIASWAIRDFDASTYAVEAATVAITKAMPVSSYDCTGKRSGPYYMVSVGWDMSSGTATRIVVDRADGSSPYEAKLLAASGTKSWRVARYTAGTVGQWRCRIWEGTRKGVGVGDPVFARSGL